MDLKTVLRNFALREIWCSPEQDHQAIFQMARLTGYGGAYQRFNHGWTRLNLPDDTSWWHVYQIGQNNPFELGLPAQRGLWISLADLCTAQGMVIDFYLENGIQLPKTQTYLARTNDKNFIVAIREVPSIADLNTQPVYIRFYTDAYYDSVRGASLKSEFVVGGGLLSTQSDIAALQQTIQSLQLKPGYLTYWLNGRYTDNVTPAKIKVGDYVEYCYDPAVVAVLDFPLTDLTSFTSTLDSLEKYILHPPKRGDNVIYYVDDIDVYLIKPTGLGDVDGIYYHRNREPALRMITHRDYSLPAAYVNGFVRDDAKWQNDAAGLVVRLLIRESGYSRSLVFENNRIQELYKLNDTKILRAFQGLDSVLPEWHADALESSAYTKIMRSSAADVTGDLAITALGYNSISTLIGNTPSVVVSAPDGLNYVDLPVGLQSDSTVYEYDTNGLLIGYYSHRSGERYYTRNAQTGLVEVLAGVGTQSLDAWYGAVSVTLDPTRGYRFYVSDVKNGVTQNNWKPVSAADGLFTITNNVLTWNYNTARQVGVVVSDATFLTYQLTLEQTNGYYRFSLNYTDLQGIVLELPPGKIELWLGGEGKPARALIPGLDYVINFPEICIVNKEWLNPTGANVITIRCTDWATSTGTVQPVTQSGWLQGGMLSNDAVYNIRDDKVIRCVVNGRTFHRDSLVFAEQRYGLQVQGSAELDDGSPYWISDVRVPLPGVTAYDTDSLRAAAGEIDQRVSAYLTQQLTPPVFVNTPTARDLYRLYSPTLTKLINDIQNGWFTPPAMPAPDRVVIESMVPYESILQYDPARAALDFRYVIVHPHPWLTTQSVTLSEYLYLQRVCALFLNGRVDITQFVTVKG